MMKRLVIFFCGTLTLTAYRSDTEEKANEELTIIHAAYERDDYEEAKTQVDSIKISYPKASEARRAGQKLMPDVELKAQQETLAFLDSAPQARRAAFDAIKGKHTLEKDVEYQQVGNCIWPTQTIERNLHRSFLHFRVNKQGIMSMTSTYCGAGSIHRVGVRVMTPDGGFTETPTPKDNYEASSMNERVEKAGYKLGEGGNVIEFLNLNKDKNIRVKFIGGHRYTTTMNPTDRQAAAGIYELPEIFSAIQQIKKEQEDANLKTGSINKKKERKTMEEATEE